MLQETPEVIVDTCACCGNEIQQGEEVLQFPNGDYYFCNQQCVFDQLLEEDNLRRVVAE